MTSPAIAAAMAIAGDFGDAVTAPPVCPHDAIVAGAIGRAPCGAAGAGWYSTDGGMTGPTAIPAA